MTRSYDYIIVGAGSAGCVLANRLSADRSCQILVLEAGGSDRAMDVQVPAAFKNLFHTKRDWAYFTASEPYVEQRCLFVPRGKMLGGSSSMNAMIYMRGSRADYDAWRDEHGLEGWGWDDVLPYFKRSEDNGRGADAYHGSGGPLRVEDRRYTSPLTHRFVDACSEAGIEPTEDFNTGEPRGAGLTQVTQRAGRRWSAADAFLRPVWTRPNLTIRTNAHVRRLHLGGDRVTAVEYAAGGKLETARAAREVLLCAGAINSPHLLMLSGIGPADHLRDHDILPRVDLPVGEGLQDHPFVALSWHTGSTASLNDAEHPRHLAPYLLGRRGKLSSNVGEACTYVRSDSAQGEPDLQFHFGPCHFQNHGAEDYDGHSFTVGPTLVAPTSRGSVRLRSAEPDAWPIIHGNYLRHREEVRALVQGVRIAREIVAQRALGDSAGSELYPGREVSSDTEIAHWVRRKTELLYHPSGTCAMGTGSRGVVDSRLRVHGISGLRVVDASVFPAIMRGNTNAPTIMVAEKAADLIRAG